MVEGSYLVCVACSAVFCYLPETYRAGALYWHWHKSEFRTNLMYVMSVHFFNAWCFSVKAALGLF
jgi:hypothetical protein